MILFANPVNLKKLEFLSYDVLLDNLPNKKFENMK